MKESTWMYIFISVFVALVLANVVVFTINKNSDFKKKYQPIGGIILMVPFALLPVVALWPSPSSLIFVAGCCLVAVLNYKLTKFCDRCGKFRYNRQMFEKMDYCSVCGEKFDR